VQDILIQALCGTNEANIAFPYKMHAKGKTTARLLLFQGKVVHSILVQHAMKADHRVAKKSFVMVRTNDLSNYNEIRVKCENVLKYVYE
jgi:hypothetical protein